MVEFDVVVSVPPALRMIVPVVVAGNPTRPLSVEPASSVPPLLTVIVEEVPRALLAALGPSPMSTPALTVVVPVKVLAACRSVVPLPDWVSEPVPLMTPATVTLLLVSNTRSPLSVTAPLPKEPVPPLPICSVPLPILVLSRSE